MKYESPKVERLGPFGLERKARKYESPRIERLGTFREITRAGGCTAMADGVNPYHRYDPNYSGCPMT